jgi:hypothetical protein
MNRFVAMTSVSALAIASALPGCSGGSPEADPGAAAAPAPREGSVVVMAEYDVLVNPVAGTMTFRPSAPADGAAANGTHTMGVGPIVVDSDGVAGSVSPANAGHSIEYQNGANQVNTGGASAANCGGRLNTFCAGLGIRSFFDRPLNGVYLEITNIAAPGTWAGYNVTPSGFSSAISTIAVEPPGYEGILATPSSSAGLIPYGDLAPGTTRFVNLYWNNGGSSTNFGFKIRVKGTSARAGYSAARAEGLDLAAEYPNGANACAVAGHQRLLRNIDDDHVAVDLPFPLTVFDKTGTRLCVSSNGVAALRNSCPAEPVRGFDTPPLSGSGLDDAPPRNAIFPFWDDLWTADNDDAICAAKVGVAPNRQFLVTWSHAATYSEETQGPSSADLTFSLVVNEQTDIVDAVYLSMTDAGVVTTRARGDMARGGITNSSTSGAGCGSGLTQRCVVAGETPSAWLSSSASAAFPLRWRYTPSL